MANNNPTPTVNPPVTFTNPPSSQNGSSGSNPSALTSPDSGLWVGVALISGVLLSGTQAAPIVFGLLTIGLIYQLQLMLQGK